MTNLLLEQDLHVEHIYNKMNLKESFYYAFFADCEEWLFPILLFIIRHQILFIYFVKI